MLLIVPRKHLASNADVPKKQASLKKWCIHEASKVSWKCKECPTLKQFSLPPSSSKGILKQQIPALEKTIQALNELWKSRWKHLPIILSSCKNTAMEKSTSGLGDLGRVVYFLLSVSLVHPIPLQSNLCLTCLSIWLLRTEHTSCAPLLIHLW